MDLNIFNTANLFEAATHLFQSLGIKLNSNTAEPLPVNELLKQHYKDNDTFKTIGKTYFIGIIDNTVFLCFQKFKLEVLENFQLKKLNPNTRSQFRQWQIIFCNLKRR